MCPALMLFAQFEDDSEESPVKLPPGHMMDSEEVRRYEEVGASTSQYVFKFAY
jgi:hypothetical protein